MKILIIEDNPMWLNKIKNIAIEKLPNFGIVSTDSISENINIKEYDLFILDIEVKDKNGIELGLKIKEENSNASIIYVSAYYTYLTQGYKTRAIAFVLKDDIRFDDLLRDAIDDFLNEKRRFSISLKIKSGVREYNVLLKDIIYIESYGRKIVYHTEDKEIEVYEKISDAEDRLSSHDFLRIHKSYIVNLAHVQYIKSYTATLDNGIILPCSELKYKDIVAKYAVYKGRF